LNSEQISKISHSQINDKWETTNVHGVDLKKALVSPRIITVNESNLLDGKNQVTLRKVWLVLIENPESEAGYRIVAELDGSMFGLAYKEYPSEEYLDLALWCDDFMTAFQAM
jgi:hypothetical protein